MKMVAFQIISEKFKDHSVLNALEKNGGFDFNDEKNIVKLQSEAFRIIPVSLEAHPFILLLSALGLFRGDEDENIVYLPVHADQATRIEVSPFCDPPIESYVAGIESTLTRMADGLAPQLKQAQNGNSVALEQLTASVRDFQSWVRESLLFGKIHAGYPSQ